MRFCKLLELLLSCLACFQVVICSGLNTEESRLDGLYDYGRHDNVDDIRLSERLLSEGVVEYLMSSGMAGPSEPIQTSCMSFIHHYSAAASKFTECSVNYSRPLRFCEHCADEYLDAVKSYNLIMEGTARDSTGTLCSDVILSSDRVQIIEQTYNLMDDMWEQCHCSACFFGFNLNTTHLELSNATTKFFEKLNATRTCFLNYTHIDTDYPEFLKNNTVNTLICDNCHDSYKELNKYYEHMTEDSQGKVCMDIVDIMNTTRLLWSRVFGCSQRDVDIIPVALMSALFCALPIIFYVANKIHGTKAEKRLLKQKRLRETQMTPPVTNTEED